MGGGGSVIQQKQVIITAAENSCNKIPVLKPDLCSGLLHSYEDLLMPVALNPEHGSTTQMQGPTHITIVLFMVWHENCKVGFSLWR